MLFIIADQSTEDQPGNGEGVESSLKDFMQVCIHIVCIYIVRVQLYIHL